MGEQPHAARLPAHNRFRYRAIGDRPAYEWPNGQRLAIYVGLNLEHFAFGEGLGAELAPGGPQPDVLNYAWREYGNRVGVWRLMDLFGELGWPVSVLANTSIYDHCPEVMDAVRTRGDEVVGHGYTNSERQGTMDEDTERRLIVDVTRTITRIESRPPKGWLGPWISESSRTPDLLAEAGYTYLLDWYMDDQPVWFATRNGGRILSVPYPQELNDIPAIAGHKDGPAQFADMIIDNFEEMLVQAERAPLVMGISLHPYIVGQPYRLRQLRRALQHIDQKRDRIWITTAGAIAGHAAPFAL
jgi:allantoinase